MEKHKKIIIGIGIFIGMLLIISIGVNFWVKHQLPKLINEQSKVYAIAYKSINVEVFSGNVDISDATIVPKATLNDTVNKAGLYATVGKIQIRNFKILSVIFSDKISARSLSLISPEISLYQTDDKAIEDPERLKHDVVQPFEKVISVSDFFLYNGDFRLMRAKKNEPVLAVSNINMTINDIRVTDKILKSKIPFGYEKYSISCDSVYSDLGQFYHIITKKIKATNTDLSIADLRMVPKDTRREFVKKLKTEKDQFNISAKDITLKNLDWGYAGNDLFVRTSLLAINNCHADIYRNKLPADDLTKKFLYNKLLRDLDFELKVDTLKIRNSLVVYEEEKSFDKGSGKLVFNKFNLMATNICSGFKRKKAGDLKIKIKCQFMDTSPLDVDWKLNIMDKSDGFSIMGTVRNFDAGKIDPFVKPYMNASVKGTLDAVHFKFKGNDLHDSGEFAIKYDDLKVKIYKKDDRSKVNKLLTAVGNLLVKDDSKGQVKSAQVELERIPEKSFYNFLWRSVADGLKKTLI
jgi:hypothetical protein